MFFKFKRLDLKSKTFYQVAVSLILIAALKPLGNMINPNPTYVIYYQSDKSENLKN